MSPSARWALFFCGAPAHSFGGRGGTPPDPFIRHEGEPALPDFDLGELGWSAELAESLQPGLVPGRVTAAHRAALPRAIG